MTTNILICQGKGEDNYKRELTRIKEVDDLKQRIRNLEAIFSKLKDIKHKQKVMVLKDASPYGSYSRIVLESNKGIKEDTEAPFSSRIMNCVAYLDYEDLKHIDADDLEEMDPKWQVAMLTMRVKSYDWSFQAEEGVTSFALMAYTSRGSSSSDSEVHTCSKDCLKSFETVQKQYDQQREAFNKSNLEIIVKDISIKNLKNQLEEALKEKDDLKLKLEKFEESSKNLTKLINSQISAKDKAGLGYDSQMNESELVHSVFNNRESDVDDSLVNDRFKTDDSVYKNKVSKTETSISKTSKDIVEKLKTVRPSAPIIEDWDIDSDNDSMFRHKIDQRKLKFTKINFVKSDENVKSVNKENTHKQVEYPTKSQSPRDNTRN
ncbi:hypothetical protein Tco_1289339 [Tanacetum coccineum]